MPSLDPGCAICCVLAGVTSSDVPEAGVISSDVADAGVFLYTSDKVTPASGTSDGVTPASGTSEGSDNMIWQASNGCCDGSTNPKAVPILFVPVTYTIG